MFSTILTFVGCRSLNIHEAVRQCRSSTVRKLLQEERALANVTDGEGFTPIFYAKELHTARLLVEHGANVNYPAKYGAYHHYYPIRRAVYADQPDLVNFLLDNGANVDQQDWSGTTPLMMAAAAGQVEILNLLLDKGADPHLRNNDGETALDYATQKGEHENTPIDFGIAKRERMRIVIKLLKSHMQKIEDAKRAILRAKEQ